MYSDRYPGAIRGVPPCKDCEERHTACHDKCPKYKEWQAEVHRVKEARKAYEDSRNDEYIEQHRRQAWRRKTF